MHTDVGAQGARFCATLGDATWACIDGLMFRTAKFGSEALRRGACAALRGDAAAAPPPAAATPGVRAGLLSPPRVGPGADAAEAAATKSKSFAFLFGAEEGQMVSIDLPNVGTTELAKGVSNQSGFASLADVDVTTGQGAQDAMEVIDTAIEEIAVARGEMGAFQKNTLESNLTSLRIHTENLTAAESSIRDADIAVELAAFTRNQIMTQSATAQLAQANALPKNVMSLLASQ